MIVCVCAGVSDRQIRRAAAEGACTVACLREALGVAARCGRCADCATRLLEEAQAMQAPVRWVGQASEARDRKAA